jgi:hypothetical protein
LVFAAIAMLAIPAQARQVTIELDVALAGSPAPEGFPPYLSVNLDDGGGSGSVTLSLGAGLTEGEYVTRWLLHLDSASRPATSPIRSSTR